MSLDFTTRPEIRGTFGAVATTHWITSAVAMSVLERGGNAFDAATSAGFVLQIVEPHLVGPGGEVPIILKRWDAPAPIVICGQGPYPEAVTPRLRQAYAIGRYWISLRMLGKSRHRFSEKNLRKMNRSRAHADSTESGCALGIVVEQGRD
jgi:hypothetical protein